MSDQPSSDDAITVVHLVRHGEVHNPEKILYGRLPGYHLSELGREMAEVVAASFAGRDITHVGSSPLERAQETANPIAGVHELPIVTDDRLIEAENYFQGMQFGVGDGSLKHPKHWPHLINPLTPSWGEPYIQQAERVLAAMGAARDAASGHEAVLVSHQLPVWTTRCKVEGRRLWHDPRKRECTLASVTSFTYEGNEIVAVAYTEPAKALLPSGKTYTAGA